METTNGRMEMDRKTVASELCRGMQGMGIDYKKTHYQVARRIRQGMDIETIIAEVPEISNWPDTVVWLRRSLGRNSAK